MTRVPFKNPRRGGRSSWEDGLVQEEDGPALVVGN